MSGAGPLLAGADGLLGPDGALGLTSTPLLVGVSVLAAALLVGATVRVPSRLRRADGSGGRGLLLQAAVLVLCPALVLGSGALWANRAFGFYGSWEALEGEGAVATTAFGAAHDAAPGDRPTESASLAAARTARVPDALADPLHDPELRGIIAGPGGQYVRVTIPGRASDVRADALVHLPRGYMTNPDRRYPVVLAFSGIPGSPATVAGALRLGERIDALATEGRLAEAIVVIPVVYPGSHDTECVDPTDGHQRYETWLASDVPAWTRAHLRTIEDPDAWATFGYSAGGWCASMLSARHPDLARSSISLGGYFQVLYARGQEHAAPDDPAYDLPGLVERERPPVAMYFFAGGEDRLSDPSLGRMERAVDAAAADGGATSLLVRRSERGGHALPLWREHLDESLVWLGRTSPGFAPA
ncbi:alpha/beta hydrolase [Brachybacterium huguangmaarense]